MNEPGALNEAMSDILAAVCESWRDQGVSDKTWLIGEDIFTPDTPNDGLRYMDDPTKDAPLYPPELGGSRDFYADRYTGSADNGGVHLNSGIPNLAFQLLVEGGSHPRGKTTFTVPGIGIEKAGAIFQHALTQGYITTNTNLAQARTATEEVADLLYPGQAKVAVGTAWAAVGIGAPPVNDDTSPPQVEIVSPADGAFVGATFSVEVQASDDKGVLSVELSVDGTVVGTDTSAPYTFNVPSLSSGSHSITATAHDTFNEASDTNTVTVATTCTAEGDCSDGQSCEAGLCMPEDASNPHDGDSGGCGCASGSARSETAATSIMLMLGTMMSLGRRRRRR
jgi:hypothetical protein